MYAFGHNVVQSVIYLTLHLLATNNTPHNVNAQSSPLLCICPFPFPHREYLDPSYHALYDLLRNVLVRIATSIGKKPIGNIHVLSHPTSYKSCPSKVQLFRTQLRRGWCGGKSGLGAWQPDIWVAGNSSEYLNLLPRTQAAAAFEQTIRTILSTINQSIVNSYRPAIYNVNSQHYMTVVRK